MSNSDRSFFVKLRLSQDDVQKLTTDAQVRFQEYLRTVAPEIREFASDDQLLKAWQKKHLCAMVKDFVSLPRTPLRKEAAMNASLSPEKVSRKFDNEPPAKRQCSVYQQEGFSRLSDVANSSKLRHDVVGKILIAAKMVENIPFKNGHLQKFTYTLGAPDGTLEVSVVGASACAFAAQVMKMLHKVVAVRRAVWDEKYQVLTHKPGTTVDLVDDDLQGDAEEEDKVDFKFQVFEAVVTMMPWSRVSVQGIIHETDTIEASSKHPEKSYLDFSIRDARNQGLKIRLVSFDNEMPKVETGRKVTVRNAKINCGTETLYADLDDLCMLEMGDKVSSSESRQQMQMVRWPRRRDI